MDKIMLKRDMSREDSYELKEYEKGYRIPIVSDTMFNTMLNNESRKIYVAYLIALTLDMDYEKVYDSLIFVKDKLDKENYHESSKTVDLVCKIDNEIIGIEMNNNTSKAALERNISYAADLYKSKMIRGSAYNYRKVIQININNFTFEGNKSTIERYSLKNEKGEVFTDKLIFIHIYLPNIRKKCYNKGVDELNNLEKLLLIFNEEENLQELCGGNEIMEKYVKDSIDASDKEEVIGLYDKELHQEKLRLSEIEEAEERGIEQGITQGIDQRNIEIAKSMLEIGISTEDIIKCTGLSKEEIEKLKKMID